VPELASRRGAGRARHDPGARALGAPDGVEATLARPGAEQAGSDGAGPARAIASSGAGGWKIGKDDDEPGFARPLIAPGPAATDAGRRALDVADRTDAAARSSELHPQRIDLSRPGPLGDGASGRGAGSLPAWSARGRGDEAVPAGWPGVARGESLEVAEHRRRYDLYVAAVKRKVNPLWEFPRELALKLEQGDVMVAFTIRRDGTVKDVKIVKRSGFARFDANVVAAIRRAAPFGHLPAQLGDELRVTAQFEGANPVVR
jgi:TonB family protein